MSVADKETIYIDAEDDVTIVIDKVRASQAKIVALVLPKRAATFQSIVNMKLLKRIGGEAKKNLVLITSEAGLLPIAGAVGLHVAKTLQSKPSIPTAPSMNNLAITVENEPLDTTGDVPIDLQTPIGQLAGQVATEETIELDNDTLSDPAVPATAGAIIKKSANKKLRVPNFDRFRVLLFGGIGLLILLIVGSVFALVVLPKAKITIKTDTASVSTDLVLTAKADAKAVDLKLLVIPGLNKQVKKTDTEKVPATGQRDEGSKATGTVTITNCNKEEEVISLPAGSILSTTSNGAALAFVTNETIVIPQSNFTGGGVCKNDSFKNVGVTAQAAGDQYNLSARRQFSIAITGLSGTDSGAMSGGTTKLVQIVSQKDIDSAKQKVLERQNGVATAELKSQFAIEKAQPLTDTFAAGAPAVVSAPNVNEPASDVNVSVTITYTQLGVKQDDLKQVVEDDIKKRIDVSKQTIQDNGLQKASILITDKKLPNEAKFNIKTIALAGPQLDADGIKKEVAGKKRRQTESIIQARPGIKEVDIKYSPFWVSKTPKSMKKITVVFDQNNASN